MNPSIDRIIKVFNKKYPPDRTLETEHFIYWIREKFCNEKYEIISREKFKELRNYVAENGSLPGADKIYNTGVGGFQKILRYSKTYDNLEYYETETDLRANNFHSHGRVVIMDKKSVRFKVTSKGFVRCGSKLWLSLKNWHHLVGSVGIELTRILMSHMLGGKEWVNDIKIEPYDIPNSIARKAHSIEHLAEIYSGSRPPKIFYKAFDNDLGDIFKLNKVIDPNQVHMLTNFIKQNKEKVGELLKSRVSDDGFGLIYLYFVCRDNRCEKNVVLDYCKMLMSQNMKINLALSSSVSIKNKHDDLSRYIIAKSGRGAKLKVARHFKELKPTKDIEVELINTAERLDNESLALHHCVHTYKNEINKGRCAIYSITYDNKMYTLQLNSHRKDDGKRLYNIAQLKGSRNSNPPIEIMNALKEFTRYNGIEDANVGLGNSLIKKRSVPQIGTAVLDKILKGQHVLHERVENNVVYPVYADDDLPF